MDKFKLQTDFKPTGDQPQAIKKIYNNLKNGVKDQTLLGVTGSGKTFTMAKVIEKHQKPTLVISHNKTLAAQLASEFQSFFPKNAVHYFVSYYDYYQPEAYILKSDTYIAKDAQINEEIDRLRHAATSSLLSRSDVIVCASVSCIYGLGSPENYESVKIHLKKGEKRILDSILSQLTEINYTRNNTDLRRGNFKVQGDILEIFPVYEKEDVVRIEFFGDEIEKISQVNFLTGKINKELDEISIYPASHYAMPSEKIKLALSQIREDLDLRLKELKNKNQLVEAQRLEQRTKFDLEMIEQTGFCSGIENYSRYFDGRKPGDTPHTLLNFYPRDFLIMADESHMTIPQIGGMYWGDRARKNSLVDYGFRLPSAYDNRPLKFAEFEKKINQVVYVSATPSPYEKEKSGNKIIEQLIRPTGLLDPTIEIKPTKNQVDDLIEQIQKRIKNKERVLVTTLTKKLSENLSEYLADIGIKVQYLHSEIDTLDRLEIIKKLRSGVFDVLVGINLLREGLDLPEVSLIAILDADKEGFLRSETALVQTMGRAARHQDGHIIMYADKMTGSMKRAIGETKRRRKIQSDHNKKHGIIPKSIKKKISDFDFITQRYKRPQKESILPKNIKDVIMRADEKGIKKLIKDLENQMDMASKNLEFEKAVVLRDEIKKIEKIIKK
ncbi:MAG: excinuclease ABC subunit UvrB [Parcubacteria group bacterium]|nr:excinuclease ABC subunit UvrB [Parcubacteria group bacterium]